MKKKIILDRFKQSSLKYFYINFKKLDFEVKIITYNEKITSPLENFSAELLNDFEIARGSFFKDLPWMLEPNDLEFLSQYEGLFCNLLSRYAISPEYWASHEMSVHAIQLFNYWKYKLIDEKIEIKRLDDFNLTADLIKIDTQGYELPILRGSIETLKKNFPVLILELENKKDLKEVELLLNPLGYIRVKSNKHDIIWACE